MHETLFKLLNQFMINVNFNKIRMSRLCCNLLSIIEHDWILIYYTINVEVKKICRNANDKWKKYDFLNRIWLEFRKNNSKLNFKLTIFLIYFDKSILIIFHFFKMFMCVEWINRYSAVFFMFNVQRFAIFL